MGTKLSLKFLLGLAFFFCIIPRTFGTLCDLSKNLLNLKNNLISSTNITISCKEQLLDYLNGLELKSKWALNMLTSGALPVVPNVNILGSFDKCVDIKHRGKLNITGQYCLVSFFPNNETYDSIFNEEKGNEASQLATCIPNQCISNDTQNFYSMLGLNVSVDSTLCQTKELGLEMTPSVIVALIVFAAIFLTVLASTFYEYFYDDKGTSFGMLSLRSNFYKLCFTGGGSGHLSCLNGIRALCILGVVLAHDEHIQFYLPVGNSWYLNQWSGSVLGALTLATGDIIVETFFLLSGFLIGYTYMKLLQRNGQLYVWKFYLARYLRLTPNLAAVILFYVSFLQYMGSGPFWPSLVTQTQVGACYSRWWMALLYIQNFSSSTHACISQSWYLTVDMQLYIFSPILLYVIKTRPKHFIKICKFLLIMSLLYTVFIVLYYQPTLPTSTQNSQQLKTASFSDIYYSYSISVLINATPWLTGIALSYIIIANQKEAVIIGKIWVIILWMLSITATIARISINSIIYSSATDPTILQDLYLIFSKLTWSFTVAWIIFACIFKYAGWVNSFLSMGVFQIISRLSYSMYLVHDAIIFSIVAQYRYPVILNNFNIISLFCTAVVFSLLASLLLTLFVELPALAISDYFLKRKTVKKSILLESAPRYTENNVS